MEEVVTIKEMAEQSGYPEKFIRAACHRERFRLPHIESGEKRPVIRIRPSTFWRWLDEEELRKTF